MPLSPQANDFMSCPICFTHFSYQRKPVTLVCSHSICSSCLKNLTRCPFDQSSINTNLPENEAILGLVAAGHYGGVREPLRTAVIESFGLSKDDAAYYYRAVDHIKQLAVFLKPQTNGLSRPMQRKLISLLHCQIIEGEGRSRAMRNIRSIGERALSELLIKHQDPHSLSTNLWAAVRARGCQFLGPAMQEEVLRLVLLALEDGSALSRKVLVMFVVQRLSPQFPHQASKTAIGHVIQLLYRASCFKLTKREGDSSLMQLKEEYCVYEALRREHDTQIVSIALEAGLRISPDQWSSVLYGDAAHKSHMQSIIDKLQSPQSFSQSIQELVIALQRTADPGNLGAIRTQFEKLAEIDCGSTSESDHPSLELLSSYLESCKIITYTLVDFLEKCSGVGFRPGRGSNFSGNLSKSNRPPRPNKAGFVAGHPNGQRSQGLLSQPDQPQGQQPLLMNAAFRDPNQVAAVGAQFPRFSKRPNAQRPCASVQPTRIGQVAGTAGLIDIIGTAQPVAPMPVMVNVPPVIATPGLAQSLDAGPKGYAQPSPLPLQPMAAVPVAIVDACGTQTGTATVLTPQPMAVGPPTAFTPLPAVVATGDPHQPGEVVQVAPLPPPPTAQLVPSLSAEADDEFIPFAESPFVSKYGPISRSMTIQTPSILGSSNTLISNGSSTQSTSVLMGPLPSLTLIQPMQQVVIAPMADPNAAGPMDQRPAIYSEMIQPSPVLQEFIHEVAPPMAEVPTQ